MMHPEPLILPASDLPKIRKALHGVWGSRFIPKAFDFCVIGTLDDVYSVYGDEVGEVCIDPDAGTAVRFVKVKTKVIPMKAEPEINLLRYFPPATNNPFLTVIYLAVHGWRYRKDAPLILDAFCGAGGAAWGYWLAGYNVVGVDINPQPNYPFPFIQGDAVEFIREHGQEFDFIHASPPCQAYTWSARRWNKVHPDLVAPTRDALKSTGRQYIIENVIGAPVKNALTLCGTMFGLGVIRHRLFETNPPIYFAPATCAHTGSVGAGDYVTVAGHGGDGISRLDVWQKSMQIWWMSKQEMTQSIPPAFTEWLGLQMMAQMVMDLAA
jgi:hypothetical protein